MQGMIDMISPRGNPRRLARALRASRRRAGDQRLQLSLSERLSGPMRGGRAFCASVESPRPRGLCLSRLAPRLHQRFEFPVRAFGQHDARRDEKVAVAAGFGRPLPFSRSTRPLLRIWRDRHLHFSGKRRHRDLCAEHGLVEADGEVEPQVGALRLEQRMRHEADRHQRVAGRSAGRRGLSLALQADHLAVGRRPSAASARRSCRSAG